MYTYITVSITVAYYSIAEEINYHSINYYSHMILCIMSVSHLQMLSYDAKLLCIKTLQRQYIKIIYDL